MSDDQTFVNYLVVYICYATRSLAYLVDMLISRTSCDWLINDWTVFVLTLSVFAEF